MEHFLFDLDGTLLPMKQEEFVKFYLPLLAARFQGRGIAPDKLIVLIRRSVPQARILWQMRL